MIRVEYFLDQQRTQKFHSEILKEEFWTWCLSIYNKIRLAKKFPAIQGKTIQIIKTNL